MEYPRTAAEFTRQFSTEEACWAYLVPRRWPEGFRCPDCGSPKAWLTSNTLFRCGACKSAVSVTAGTIFQDTRKPLKRWFQAMWWIVWQKNGARAVGLNAVGHDGRFGPMAVDPAAEPDADVRILLARAAEPGADESRLRLDDRAGMARGSRGHFKHELGGRVAGLPGGIGFRVRRRRNQRNA